MPTKKKPTPDTEARELFAQWIAAAPRNERGAPIALVINRGGTRARSRFDVYIPDAKTGRPHWASGTLASAYPDLTKHYDDKAQNFAIGGYGFSRRLHLTQAIEYAIERAATTLPDPMGVVRAEGMGVRAVIEWVEL